MKIKAFHFSTLLLSALALSGCASIVEGSSQQITINTNPSGASCVLERNNVPLGTVSPTPGSILIQKTKHDIVIKCTREGHQETTYFNKSGSAGATFGNIVAGGLIGWGIDSASGADNKYESPINITLATYGGSVPVIQGTSTPVTSPEEANSSSTDYPSER